MFSEDFNFFLYGFIGWLAYVTSRSSCEVCVPGGNNATFVTIRPIPQPSYILSRLAGMDRVVTNELTCSLI